MYAQSKPPFLQESLSSPPSARGDRDEGRGHRECADPHRGDTCRTFPSPGRHIACEQTHRIPCRCRLPERKTHRSGGTWRSASAPLCSKTLPSFSPPCVCGTSPTPFFWFCVCVCVCKTLEQEGQKENQTKPSHTDILALTRTHLLPLHGDGEYGSRLCRLSSSGSSRLPFQKVPYSSFSSSSSPLSRVFVPPLAFGPPSLPGPPVRLACFGR